MVFSQTSWPSHSLMHQNIHKEARTIPSVLFHQVFYASDTVEKIQLFGQAMQLAPFQNTQNIFYQRSKSNLKSTHSIY